MTISKFNIGDKVFTATTELVTKDSGICPVCAGSGHWFGARAEWRQAVESSYLAMTGLVDRRFHGATHFDVCTNRRGWQHKRHLVGVGGIGRTCFMRQGKWENAP